MNLRFAAFGIAAVWLMNSCGGEVIPKPKAMLRLDYPPQVYREYADRCPFQFQYSTGAQLEVLDGCNLILKYPELKGSIYISYKPVEANLTELLRDAEKLAYEHVVKADAIPEQEFANEADGVYGMYYEVSGNAASQAQFYLTDSSSHFLAGSLYFEARPNYDSILPAASYLREDMRRLMESLRWKKLK
ncbi:MAG: gliding motility lipoprotein GldD [Bacteroidota bacterium]|jgi:gliding motility-associated lipoprotein GldD